MFDKSNQLIFYINAGYKPAEKILINENAQIITTQRANGALPGVIIHPCRRCAHVYVGKCVSFNGRVNVSQ